MEVRKSPQRRPLFLKTESPPTFQRPQPTCPNYRRVAILPSSQEVVFTPSAKNWEKVVRYTKTVDAFGIESIGNTYDGYPIFLVSPDKALDVCLSFKPGTYGLDTESDVKTQELRLIQISTGTATYIFTSDSLFVDSQVGIPKFLKAKDRIKIGVDIEADARKINTQYNEWLQNRSEGIYSKRFEVGGTIDLQNMSRALHTVKPPISLKSLIKEYLPEFSYKEMKHDSYLNPTLEQYIYAANDAAAPLQIYYKILPRK